MAPLLLSMRLKMICVRVCLAQSGSGPRKWFVSILMYCAARHLSFRATSETAILEPVGHAPGQEKTCGAYGIYLRVWIPWKRDRSQFRCNLSNPDVTLEEI